MFKKLFGQFQDFGDFIDWLLRIGAVVAMISPLIVAIRKWVVLDTTDLWIIGVGLCGLLLVVISLILRWVKNRSVRRIPEILTKMDEKMHSLISTASLSENENGMQFLIDASELWDIDIPRIKAAKDVSDLRIMVKEWENKPNPYSQSSSQPFKIISEFLQTLRGLMQTDNVGTDSIKDQEFIKLEKKLVSLQKRLKDSRSIKSLDRYLMWWNGSNSYLLFKQYSKNNPVAPLIAPAKVKAVMPQFENLLQIAVHEYLGYVKDGIYGRSDIKDELKPIE